MGRTLSNVTNKDYVLLKGHLKRHTFFCIKQYCESIGQSRIIEQLDVSITANPNSNYNILDGILHKLYEKHFPNKIVRFNKYKPEKSTWITMGIIKSIQHKDK